MIIDIKIPNIGGIRCTKSKEMIGDLAPFLSLDLKKGQGHRR